MPFRFVFIVVLVDFVVGKNSRKQWATRSVKLMYFRRNTSGIEITWHDWCWLALAECADVN